MTYTKDEAAHAGLVRIGDEWYAATHPAARALRDAGSPRPAPVVERPAGDGSLAEARLQAQAGRRFLVVVKSYRKRLLDYDNLAEKYLVDLCRYAGIIPSDAPGVAQIEVCQEKVGPKEPERTTVQIYSL